MKKIHILALALIGIYTCFNFTSCKKDDDPSESSIRGVWYDGRSLNSDYDDSEMDLLITDSVWLWGDGVDAKTLSAYKNSSFDELAKRFAPDDEFLVYRYDSKNNVYLMYESGDWIDGKLYIHVGYFYVVKLNVSGNSLDIEMYSYVQNPNYPDDEYEEWPFPAVTYEELMSDPQFATLPSNIKLRNPEYITYFRYK